MAVVYPMYLYEGTQTFKVEPGSRVLSVGRQPESGMAMVWLCHPTGKNENMTVDLELTVVRTFTEFNRDWLAFIGTVQVPADPTMGLVAYDLHVWERKR